MVLESNGATLVYEYNGCKGTPVLLLHGWGGGIESFKGVYNRLTSRGIPAINVAFPKTVPAHYGIFEYAALIEELIAALKIKPVVVGHSFGGRVSIILAAKGLANSAVLIDSAGIKPRFSIKRAIKIYRYKAAKRHGRDTGTFGSADYRALDAVQKQVFTRIVNQDLKYLLSRISIPTLIFWGRYDVDTPPYMAKIMKRKIRNSALIMLDGGHYSYIDDSNFLPALLSFITDTED